MSDFSPSDLRRAFGRYPTGVTVVTTQTKDGKNVGFTANSFTSVSMSPPLVLVCLDHRSTVHQAFIEAGGLVINILAQDQKDTAIRFASKVPDRFDGVQWVTGTTGLPVLAQHAAYFECVLDSAIPAGDHTIFVGRVIAIGDTEAAPLGFHSGSFKRVSCDDLASSSA